MSLSPQPSTSPNARITAHGKFFRLAGQKWFIKGLTYGPFAPDDQGNFFPPRDQLRRDVLQIAQWGANCLRLYNAPPGDLMDEAHAAGLRVFLDLPWEKHRCFLEDRPAIQNARRQVQATARDLGHHPSLFAISVGNEIPKDIVRYHGHRRIERFLEELVDIVKQECPSCLATYTNYPSTEFLEIPNADFTCFNLYLHEPHRLSAYLDRLQHLSGPRPLVLGEFGIDSLRHGEPAQATQLSSHLGQVLQHGLAGSFIFSYTDDWFTGGHQITDWAFGITTASRHPKPAALQLQKLWSAPPLANLPSDLPFVSIIVCAHNAAATLDECLQSLTRLNYSKYEVILVDDGSTDNTRSILARYPAVKAIHQPNQGLSVARNVGAQAARGQIIAYTDADCIADEDWLHYLVSTMLDRQLDAAGGPNLPPPDDGLIARCVAASPGGPTHVMLDDQIAEHIPGCNMAFRHDKLLAIGGFDPRFRAAGDDVDICWRFQNVGLKIGFSPSAVVWHRRRSSIRTFFKQQAGYGKAEALLHTKHAHRFNRLGAARWLGVIYGDLAAASQAQNPAIYHGQFGQAPFQIAYRSNRPSIWACCTLLEWHAIALFILLSSTLLPWLALLSAAMEALTVASIFRSVASLRLPLGQKSIVFFLHLFQPIIRSFHRHARRLRSKRLPYIPADDRFSPAHLHRISRRRVDLYWTSSQSRGREHLLDALQLEISRANLEADDHSHWSAWDIHLTGNLWHQVFIHTASEDLGQCRRFTRARSTVHLSPLTWIILAALSLWTALALLTWHLYPAMAGAALLLFLPLILLASQRRCLQTTTRLLWRAGLHARLDHFAPSRIPVSDSATSPEIRAIVTSRF